MVLRVLVVYRTIPTSNHNALLFFCHFEIVVYRTIPTSNHNSASKFLKMARVVYRTIPTSNHNSAPSYVAKYVLYIVLFLHQTTTGGYSPRYLLSCISYYSYIKPQPQIYAETLVLVVYRTIPTSNHNRLLSCLVILALYIVLFLHQTTTFTISRTASYLLYIVLFLHQTTTLKRKGYTYDRLYIVLFLHQTTTGLQLPHRWICCISYYSYIKPQPRRCHTAGACVVYRTIPTSNHNSLGMLLPCYVLYIVLFLHQTTT